VSWESGETVAEETANSITHGIGALLGIAALSLLVTFAVLRSAGARTVVACCVYGASLILLYTSSTLYHAFPWPRVKRVFQIIDHAAIYILIAGTYTPFTLVCLKGRWGWSLFGVMWGFAALGIALQPFLINRMPLFSTIIYIAMGWMIVIAIKPVLISVPRIGLVFLFAGGAAYTLGTIFYGMKRMSFHHTTWHLFVLAGSILHFFAVWYSVIPSA